MKEELKEQAELAIVDIIDSLAKAKDFAIDQAPDVIHQLLAYNMIVWCGWLLLWVIFLLPSVWWLYKYAKMTQEDECYFPGVFIMGLSTIVFAIAVWGCLFDGVLKIWLAPKVWLIEYAANLI